MPSCRLLRLHNAARRGDHDPTTAREWYIPSRSGLATTSTRHIGHRQIDSRVLHSTIAGRRSTSPMPEGGPIWKSGLINHYQKSAGFQILSESLCLHSAPVHTKYAGCCCHLLAALRFFHSVCVHTFVE